MEVLLLGFLYLPCPFSLFALFTISSPLFLIFCFMLSTFLCHIVPYGKLRAVLELQWHYDYCKGSGKGQKRTHRPFICFTLWFCLSISHTHTRTNTHLLNYLLWLCICTSVFDVFWCAHSVCVFVVFLCKQSLLCVCVPIGWVHVGAGTHWQMRHREALYIAEELAL